MTQEELLIVAAWLIGGAPEGKPALLPTQSSKTAGQPAAPMRDVVVITTPATLRDAVAVAGIRPLPEHPVNSARIVACLPNGAIEPLIWLYKFDPKWNRAFHFVSLSNCRQALAFSHRYPCVLCSKLVFPACMQGAKDL